MYSLRNGTAIAIVAITVTGVAVKPVALAPVCGDWYSRNNYKQARCPAFRPLRQL